MKTRPQWEHEDGTLCVAGHTADLICAEGGGPVRQRPENRTPVWPTLAALVDWLNTANGSGERETSLRLLKLVEEAGEVASAYAGAVGQNPRKGRTHTYVDVADELCDVALTALVALHSFVPDPEGHFAARLAHVSARVGVHTSSEETSR